MLWSSYSLDSRPILPDVVAAGYRECSLTAHPAVPPLRGLAPLCHFEASSLLQLPVHLALDVVLASVSRAAQDSWGGAIAVESCS